MDKENLDKDLQKKYERLQRILTELEKVVVAFSGGVDSTFLLLAAVKTLGVDNVLAVTALSETTPRHERDDAQKYARQFSAKHIMVESEELHLPEFIQNPPNKCYVCKKSRFTHLQELGRERGFSVVVDGENVDDKQDFRPGSIAARELGVRSPLREAGLSKQDIRVLSKQAGLATWDKPSYACLASRIAYHQEITPEKLRQVDDGEQFLRALGLSPQLRVRHHGELARIELSKEDIASLADKQLRSRMVAFFKSLGFQYVTLDLEGYSMGSLNRSVTEKY